MSQMGQYLTHAQNEASARAEFHAPTPTVGYRASGGSTIRGSRIVKVEPRPGSLATVMSPPIIWQKRLLIASPRPVPPYLRVVDASAWENSWNSLPLFSGVLPMSGVAGC